MTENGSRHLRVLIADEDKDALHQLADVLDELGHEVAPYAVSVSEAVELIATEDPDLAIVVVHQDDDHALALIAETVEYASGPVIAQTRDGDVEFVAARGRARDLGVDRVQHAGDRPGRDRGRAAPLRGDRAAGGQGRPAGVRAAAARADRAREGHPDGAPRDRRARRRSS